MHLRGIGEILDLRRIKLSEGERGNITLYTVFHEGQMKRDSGQDTLLIKRRQVLTVVRDASHRK